MKKIYNVLFFGSSELLTQLFNLSIGVVIARRFGSENFGSYSFHQSLASILALISILGLNTLVVKQISKGDINFVSTSFLIKVVLQILALLVFPILLIFSKNTLLFSILFLYLNLENWMNYLLMFFRGNKDFVNESSIKICYRISQFFVLMSLYLNLFPFDFSTVNLLMVLSLVSFISIVASVLSLKRYDWFRINLKTLNVAEIIIRLRESIFIGLSAFLWLFYYKIDVVLLGLLSGDNSVGIYSASYSVVKVVFTGYSAFASLLFPYMVSWHSNGILLKKFKTYLLFLILIGVIVSFSGFVFSEAIIKAIYGANFISAVFATKILSLSLIFMLINPIFINIIVAQSKHSNLLLAMLFGAFVSLILNFQLIKVYDYLGPAIVTVFVEGLMSVIFYFIIFHNAGKKDLNRENSLPLK